MTIQSIDSTIVTTSALVAGDQLRQNAAAGSKWPALFSAALGAVILFGVGFSNLTVAHNAAHDTRHSMVFPCH